jgi:outer membrane receptor protein involved in Fe transport
MFVFPLMIRRRLLLAASSLATGLCCLAAPAAAQTPAPSSKPEEAVVLNPFTVTSEKDQGYVATSSLAGTRIKSDLKDLANSITVATKEFLVDVNATDAASLLVYTGNTEVGGPGGNFSAASFGAETVEQVSFRNPQNNTRIRGLASADLTRDYFPTTITFDSYNTERVEVNRGPNATLFGLGSPGGIINNQTIQPLLRKSTTSLEFNTASFGTARSVLDVDRTLLQGRAGIRFSAVYEDQKFAQDFAFNRDRRAFLALRAKPFLNANLRVSYEKGAIDANRPRTNAPRDVLTRWWNPIFNKITHDPANVDFNAINRDLLRAPGEWFAQPGLMFDSTTASAPTRLMRAWNVETGRGLTPTGPTSPAFQGNMVSITKGSQWFPSASAAASGIQHGSFYIDDELSNPSIFDWRHQLLDGPNKREWEDFHVLNASYDQSWEHSLGRIGFELAYNHEDLTRNWYALLNVNRGYAINIDLNTTLPIGGPNPNFGRPFVASGSQRNTNHSERNTARATTFVELDFARRSDSAIKWLGRHSLTGFYNRYELDEQAYNGSNRTGLEWVNFARRNTATPDDLNTEDGTLHSVVYLGPSLANLSSPAGIHLQGLQTVINPAQSVTGYHWDQTTRSFRTIQSTGMSVLDDKTFEKITSGASLTRQKIRTYALVDQFHLLPGEWVVGTVGWRRDRVEDFRRNLTAADRNRFGMLDRSNPNFRLPSAPGSIFAEDILSYGVVVHTPRFIPLPKGTQASVHYNTSENFQPADARIDIFGKPVQPPSGTTKDYGFTLSLLDEKLSARFNWFESESARASFGYQGFLAGETDARVVRYNTPAALAAAGWKGVPQFFKDLTGWQELASPSTPSGVDVRYTRPGNMSDTQSTASKGFELDLTYNPTPNWRIAFNAAQQKAVRADIAPSSQAFLKLRIDEWLTGPTSNLIADESGQPVKVRVYDTLLNGFNGQLAREGQRVSELREWRANFVTNYRFPTVSPFSGWSFGGAVRWQDKVGIGYPIINLRQGTSNLEIPDLARPYFGPSQTTLDSWIGYTRKIMRDKVRLRVMLNVRNLIGNDDLVPVAAQPDGSIASYLAPVGRTFNLKTVFEF